MEQKPNLLQWPIVHHQTQRSGPYRITEFPTVAHSAQGSKKSNTSRQIRIYTNITLGHVPEGQLGLLAKSLSTKNLTLLSIKGTHARDFIVRLSRFLGIIQ
jgi:hypothetical protein